MAGSLVQRCGPSPHISVWQTITGVPPNRIAFQSQGLSHGSYFQSQPLELSEAGSSGSPATSQTALGFLIPIFQRRTQKTQRGELICHNSNSNPEPLIANVVLRPPLKTPQLRASYRTAGVVWLCDGATLKPLSLGTCAQQGALGQERSSGGGEGSQAPRVGTPAQSTEEHTEVRTSRRSLCDLSKLSDLPELCSVVFKKEIFLIVGLGE